MRGGVTHGACEDQKIGGDAEAAARESRDEILLEGIICAARTWKESRGDGVQSGKG